MTTTLQDLIDQHGWDQLNRSCRQGIYAAVKAGSIRQPQPAEMDDITQNGFIRLHQWLSRLDETPDREGHLGMVRHCGHLAALDSLKKRPLPTTEVSQDSPSPVGPIDTTKLEALIETIPDTGSLRQFAWKIATSDMGREAAAEAIGRTKKYQSYLCNQIRKAWVEDQQPWVPISDHK